MEDTYRRNVEEEIRRAMSAIQLAQEILARLATTDGSMQRLLQERAEALGSRLTTMEMSAVVEYLEGESPEAIAEARGLSVRTISNQIGAGCHKLGFRDRREMRGWSAAVRGFIFTQPPSAS